MRELTQEEIDLAPDWATHYFIDRLTGKVCFENDYTYWYHDGFGGGTQMYNWNGITKESKPMPRKAFDISGYAFEDADMNEASITVGCNDIHIAFPDQLDELFLGKDDIIAIAKALGVTGGDL